jgi:hypothetical protein
MLTLILTSLVVWSGALLFMAWQLWIAPEGYEDAEGFHRVPAPVSRWRHVQLHHRRRSHRVFRHGPIPN